MNREEMLNELLKKVMAVVEANKYNLSSAVRDWNVPYPPELMLQGKTHTSDYYSYSQGLNVGSNFVNQFIWDNLGQTLLIDCYALKK